MGNYVSILAESEVSKLFNVWEKINKEEKLMRTAIVYYSMSGNTEFVADKIAKNIDADVIRIQPVKEYPNQGVRKFIWGGKSAVMGDKPKLLSS